MDKVLAYVKSLYKQGLIQNFNINLDSEVNPKCNFVLYTIINDEKGFPHQYEWNVRISNYRMLVFSKTLTKEEQSKWEEVFGQFIQRDISRNCVYVQNKWSGIPDFDYVVEILEYLLKPEINIRKPRKDRNIVQTQF